MGVHEMESDSVALVGDDSDVHMNVNIEKRSRLLCSERQARICFVSFASTMHRCTAVMGWATWRYIRRSSMIRTRMDKSDARYIETNARHAPG